MKKTNCSFFIMQLIFAVTLSTVLLFAGCSRTNTGTDPAPPGGEIVFAYNIELAVDGACSSEKSPIWWDGGATPIVAHISFKADPNEPVEEVPVTFIVSGGGKLYDFHDTSKEYGIVATVYTNSSGNALVFYGTVGEYRTETRSYYNKDTGKVEEREVPVPDFSNQTITACVAEDVVGVLYDNCRTVTIYVNGPEVE